MRPPSFSAQGVGRRARRHPPPPPPPRVDGSCSHRVGVHTSCEALPPSWPVWWLRLGGRLVSRPARPPAPRLAERHPRRRRRPRCCLFDSPLTCHRHLCSTLTCSCREVCALHPHRRSFDCRTAGCPPLLPVPICASSVACTGGGGGGGGSYAAVGILVYFYLLRSRWTPHLLDAVGGLAADTLCVVS